MLERIRGSLGKPMRLSVVRHPTLVGKIQSGTRIAAPRWQKQKYSAIFTRSAADIEVLCASTAIDHQQFTARMRFATQQEPTEVGTAVYFQQDFRQLPAGCRSKSARHARESAYCHVVSEPRGRKPAVVAKGCTRIETGAGARKGRLLPSVPYPDWGSSAVAGKPSAGPSRAPLTEISPCDQPTASSRYPSMMRARP